MEIVNQLVVAFFVAGVTVASVLGTLWYVGRRNRLKAEKEFAAVEPAATTPTPSPPAFDPTGLIEALRVVTESCQAQAAVIQQHERYFHHHQQTLEIHDSALVQFQHDKAFTAHAIAQLQEGVRDLTAITSKGLPSGKMYPSVNEFLNQTMPEAAASVSTEEKIIIDEDEPAPHQPPDVPAKMPPPFPEAKVKPKGRRKP